ncbi:MAG TPA: hypothetical protein VFM93_11215, partial [Candidatus Limnocylindria bacterium]|nr:hypothetical protein [Candidatus Limnocylindria bacterium]
RLEVNGGPERLDLPDVWVRKAVERGVRLVVSSDAHAIEELDYMSNGVGVARRGWCGPGSVENTMGLDALLSLRRKRHR